jgi:hypothetical protein
MTEFAPETGKASAKRTILEFNTPDIISLHIDFI